jgi:chaperonin GroES
MKFRPLHDRVVVKRIDAEEKSAGGIIIPDSAKEKPSQGEITAVGPGGRDEAGKLIPIDLKVGDRVLFGKWSGTEVKRATSWAFSLICPSRKRRPRKRLSFNFQGNHNGQ